MKTHVHVIKVVSHLTSDGRYPFDVIVSVFFDTLWWKVIEFEHPIKRCVECGLVVGYEFDPRNLPQTDDGLQDELELCMEAQS